MNVKALMDEYVVELTDVRWYLSLKTAERLLTYKEDVRGLTHLLWSGRLEADLYNMEESYLDELQDQVDRKLVDEVEVREIFSEIAAAKEGRRG